MNNFELGIKKNDEKFEITMSGRAIELMSGLATLVEHLSKSMNIETIELYKELMKTEEELSTLTKVAKNDKEAVSKAIDELFQKYKGDR